MRYYHDHHGEGAVQEILDDPRDRARYNPDDLELTTVGVDIGSSTSHLVFSRLHLRRLGVRLSSRFVVVSRETLHRSSIMLTPYTNDDRIDTPRLHEFIERAYSQARLTPTAIDTGAVILTGEAVKRKNARAIAELFATESGKFVCATAGHHLEAAMAAYGSGAVTRSRRRGTTVLNVDVGGGTAKLALVRAGEVVETAAINVGGRLVAFDDHGVATRVEPAALLVADALGLDLQPGDVVTASHIRALAEALGDCLVSIIRREPLSPLSRSLMLTRLLESHDIPDAITFSGGVSEYLYDQEDCDFGDLSRALARALRDRIDRGLLPAPVEPPAERIRATVLGASQFTVQVSGDTISISRPAVLPLRNIQVLYPRIPPRDVTNAREITAAIRDAFQRFDLREGERPVALAFDWNGTPSYQSLRNLADGILEGLPHTISQGFPVVLVFSRDVGKLIGDLIRLELGITNDVISIDSIELKEFDYIDIGGVIPSSRVVPVVIKSLVFPGIGDQASE